jgi:hypothetical protein
LDAAAAFFVEEQIAAIAVADEVAARLAGPRVGPRDEGEEGERQPTHGTIVAHRIRSIVGHLS